MAGCNLGQLAALSAGSRTLIGQRDGGWTCRFDLRRIVASRAECAHSSVQTVGSALDRTVQIAIDRYVRI